MIKITINTDNDAFDDGDNGASEVARILRALADRLAENGIVALPCHLRDINGNRVGYADDTIDGK